MADRVVMKVFWSWQSDLPGKISRHFVREVLDQAITQVNAAFAVEEPQRESEVSLDHDRKGTPGSPALAELIFEKIRGSDVFVADVTPIGQTSGSPMKKLINANVAIELGYAIGAHSDRRLLMVLNTAYGQREDLPFDLRHKAGPIMYALEEAADKATRETVRKQLVGDFKIALRAFLNVHLPATLAFQRTPSIVGDGSRYFKTTDALVERQASFGQPAASLTVPDGPLVYLRVSPSKPVKTLSFPDALDAAIQDQLRQFAHDLSSWDTVVNSFGAIAFDAIESEKRILRATQLFRTGEVWGFDSYLPRPTNRPNDSAPSGMWAREMEMAYMQCLPTYVDFLRTRLKCEAPFEIEAGLSSARKLRLYVSSGRETWISGPFLTDEVTIRVRLATATKEDIDTALLTIFEGFFEAVGQRRPAGFNNFPKQA
jgi:hypothetical protein